MLFADDTLDTFGIGKAAILVKIGVSYFQCMFFHKIQTPDSTCGTDLSAEDAVVLAVAENGGAEQDANSRGGDEFGETGVDPGGRLGAVLFSGRVAQL